MNFQKYAAIYAKYHDSFTYDIYNDIIIIRYTDVKNIKDIILTLELYSSTKDNLNKPLIESFKIYYKTAAIATVFHGQPNLDTRILLGNERLIYSDPLGSCMMCATPYFMRDASVLEQYIAGTGQKIHPNIYFYRNTILYLDPYDVPYPGGSYFDHDKQTDQLYRLCFLTAHDTEMKEIARDFQSNRNVLIQPFKTRAVEAPVSKFIPFQPVPDMTFSDNDSIDIVNINKNLCFKNPSFILQDILNTFKSRRGGTAIDSLGLFIEYPVKINFDGTSEEKRTCGLSQFIPLVVNGYNPKTVLYIRYPYERYIEYKYKPNISYEKILYYDKPLYKNTVPVIIDHTIVGFIYRNAFFCLSVPLLQSHLLDKNRNVSYILNTLVDCDMFLDESVNVIETYRYCENFLLHRVRHKTIAHELWCLNQCKEKDFATYFSKSPNPPYLVREWLKFYDDNKAGKKINFGNLEVIKRAFIFARHKICFKLQKTAENHGVEFGKNNDIILKVNNDSFKFINTLRLESLKRENSEGGEGENGSEEGACTIS